MWGSVGRRLCQQCGEQPLPTKDAGRAVELHENPRSLLGAIPSMEGVPGHGAGSATSGPAATKQPLVRGTGQHQPGLS